MVTSFITVARLTSGSNSGVVEGFELPTVGICCTSSFNSLVAMVLGSEQGGVSKWIVRAGFGSLGFARVRLSQFSSVQFACFR